MLSVVGGQEQVAFALEWYISWFAHSTIADLNVILRLYDFAISTQCQRIGLYMVVAVLLEHKKAMMESVDSLTDFVVFCGGGGEVDEGQRVQFTDDSVEAMIGRAQRIMDRERKEEQRRNQWKANKLEIRRTFLRIKRKSKELGVIIDDLVKKERD